MVDRNAWLIIIVAVSIVSNLTSCFPSTWNKGNTKIAFAPRVANRIEQCGKPVHLIESEKNELENSLSGRVEDMFVDDEMSDDILAFHELTTKGINRNNIVFLRLSKDKQRYVNLTYTMNGHLFGAGGGRAGGLSRIWSETVDCP